MGSAVSLKYKDHPKNLNIFFGFCKANKFKFKLQLLQHVQAENTELAVIFEGNFVFLAKMPSFSRQGGHISP